MRFSFVSNDKPLPYDLQILEKAIFNADVINARHDWGTRYLEWTSKAFTLDRYYRRTNNTLDGNIEVNDM